MNDHADMSAAVAIVGMAGRFPAAPDLDTFWENLVAGRDSISRFSEGELRASGVQPETFRSSRYVPSRSVLDGPGAFDAAFFGIGRREAELMDPQHRLFLECVWEALESAGYDLHRREGLVGLFGGSTMSTYYTNNIQRSAGAEQWPDWFQAWTGNDKEYLVTRAGYHLNLKGPCICVQSACSTSLVAVHQGVAALLSRECDLALAGGVTLRTPQRVGYLFEEGGIFSPDGHCKPFDERADGTVFGDGCGVVALRRLEEALADGDQVRAVILGTSVNNDGAAKVGFTAPSAPAQVRLITEALAVAGLDGLAVDYVEAHGTGTALGDALELQALGEALQADRRETACYVGSVKGNVGHLECAAGVAGLIKTVLMLERKKILPTAHFSALNHAAPQTTGLKVCEQLIDWPIGKRPRCAGVTSLGIGGTNAHIVLQEAPPSTDARLELRDHVFVHPVSARSSAALVEAVQRHARRVAQAATERQLGDVAYAAAMRRTHHPFRVAAAGANKAELLAELERTASALSDQEPTAAGELPRRVFVFSGQGSQWLGMGLDLRSQSAVFRRKIEEVDEVLKPRAGGASVLELLRGRDDEAIERMDRVQPALFAIATAYVELWKELGVEADAVVGHSMGEVAAAHVAGILSLEDAAVLITARSRLFHERCRPGGSMAMVELGDEAIATFLEAEPQVSVAANNGRRSTVISGESGAVRRLMETFEELGVYCRDVKVQYAAHSPMVEPMREALVDALSGIRPQRARIPMLSTTTLDFLEGPEAGPDYWARNLREPVRFAAAIRQLSSGGDCAFFELAPHPILQPFVESELREEGERGICVGTESRKATGRVALLRSLCRAYQAGLPVHWQRLQAPDARHTTLPHYPWQREQFWVDPDMALAARTAVEQETHPSLGRLDARLAHAGVWSWERRFSLESEPVFVDHVVAGANIAPGSLFIEIALAAAVECGCARELRALDLREVLRFEPDSDTVVQTSVRELTGGGFDLSISSRVARDAAEQGAEPWIVHATARLSSLKSRVAPAMNWEASVAGCDQKVEAQGYYAQLRAMDLQYGPGFRALQSLSHGEGRAYGDVALPSGVARGPWRIHPVLLDACFQLLPAAYGEAEGVPQVVLSGVDHICAHRPIGARAQSVVQCSGSLDEERGLTANITVLSEEGRVALEFLGVRLHAVQPRRASASLPREGLCWLQTEVQPAPLQGPAGEGASGVRRWLAVDAVGCWSRDLVVAFEAVGDECVTLTEDDSATLASRLRKVLRGADGEAWDGVLLLAPTTPISESSTTKEVLRAQEDRYVATLEVLHSLAGCSETGAPRVYLVAQTDLQADRSLSIGLEHAALWGLGRCVPYELPQLRCTRLAVGLHGREAARRIVDEVRCGLREEEVYLEATGRSVARVLSVPVKGLRGAHKGRPRETWVRPESAFVVTGGLGGLGMATARWLVERGARTLVLLGRSLPTEAQEERLDELRATGVTVRFVQVDVSMSDQVEAVFADLQYSAPPIRGIIHAAGVAADGLMVDQTVEHWNAAAAPKVAGAWNLHRATQGLALDVFVMYSSVAGVMGGPGVAGYAAANVGLDALAHYRRDLGLPALSVNWGWFAGVGLGADADLQRLLMARGVDTLGVDEGGAILDILLSRGVTQAAALRWEPRRWLEFFPERQSSTMLAPLLEQVTAEARCAIDVQGEVLRGLDPRVRVKEIERLVCACTADVLRTDPAGLSADQPFRAMGIDSLMGLAVRNRIENALGITLSATLIWTYPTIAELAAHLCECLGDEQGADLESMASDDLVRMGEQWLSK